MFSPVCKERVWGGSSLEKMVNCKNPGQGPIGEAWIVSDHPEGKTRILNGACSGRFLSEVKQTHRTWFSPFPMAKFPLLVKLLDAADDLSVQVHPDDAYAITHEHDGSGKTECWYIIDAKPGSEIILGHTAKDRSEFIELAKAQRWKDLLVRVPVKAGDFFFIPSGSVHALGKGILLLEVQQNSDTTYRIYDYDRAGLDGRKRALHMEKALDVIDFDKRNNQLKPCVVYENNIERTVFISCEYFTVEKWTINSMHIFDSLEVFLLIYIVSGNGHLLYEDGLLHLSKGLSIMIPANMGPYRIEGSIEAIACHI
jgi:mannose-6-phosphate isomerase